MYLAMGMPAREYWDEDCWMVRAYREADRIRMQRANEQAWLQGAYIYDVMTRLYSIYNPFSKHPKAVPYLDKPYELFAKKQEEEENMTEEELQQKVEESRDAFMAMMLKKNKETADKRRKGGAGDGGGGGKSS